MTNRSVLAIALLICIVDSAYSDQDTVTVQVNVTGATPGKGQIILSLFFTAENYLKSPILSRTKPVNTEGIAEFELSNLLPGSYALNAFYDEDSNGELNTGMFGVPKELVGFSNNAKGFFGPPKFEKVVFEAFKPQQININLGKAKN